MHSSERRCATGSTVARMLSTVAESLAWVRHNRAAAFAVGSCVELGSCCFGFLSPGLAAAGPRITAVDLVPGTVRLLEATPGPS